MANEFVDTTLLDGFADGPHITEKQVGLVNQGTYGPDDYVLETGRQAEAQILTNNSIRIFDAVYVIQGRRDAIAANDYTDVSIDNGAQGMNRNDIIVRRYEKDESSEIESVSYAVIKGTPNEGPAVDPAVTEGDIRSGATLHEMKLYRVKLEGLNIVAVEPLFSVLMNMSTLNAYLSDLSSKLAVVKFTIANTSYVNMPAQNCYYEPLTGKVHIEAVFLNSGGNIPGQTALATVPSLYRPLATHDFPAMFNNSCGSAAIDTSGVLRQYTSNTQQYMYISTDYFI